jgi:hypothetical protein
MKIESTSVLFTASSDVVLSVFHGYANMRKPRYLYVIPVLVATSIADINSDKML